MDQQIAKPAALSVLLAEDNVVNQRVATALLGKIGHKVTVCGNGREAVQAVKDGHFDVVLMDIQMPVMDGLTATAAIRALDDPAKARIPILAISANVRDSDVADYRAHGITDILTKPLRPDALRQVMANCQPAAAAPSAAPLLDDAQLAALRDALPPAKLAELFAIARQSLGQCHGEIRQGWRDRDGARVKAAAHKLAGVARNFGCSALGDCAAAIEAAAAGDLGAGLGDRLDDLLLRSLAALADPA